MKNSKGNLFPNTPPKDLLEKASVSAELPSPQTRRKIPIDEMSRLESKGLSCLSCAGMCCTNEYNSMQVDTVQALELLVWLDEQGRLTEKLKEELKESVAKFRLDREFSLGRNREFRLYFTCPFYNGSVKGCSVSRAAKPYGCLGFNPLESNVSTPGKCASNKASLTEREDKFSPAEKKAHDFIKEELNIYWDKKNLPFALLDMIRAMEETTEANKSEKKTCDIPRKKE